MKFYHVVAAPLLGLALVAGCRAEPAPTAATATAANPLPLEIRTGKGLRRLKVEVARTVDEQAKGLMYRESLPANGGMLFPFSPPRPASFWMKNTVIPLDMIFIRADGTIARVAANTVPYSFDPVESGEPVQAVLEIAGGRAAKLGIAEGDRVSWKK